jgi:uncharacterized protein (PEP-CTERM system associated)
VGRVLAAFLPLALTLTGPAAAFPFIDPTNQDALPGGAPLGTELPTEDVHGLGNQLRLVNPAAPGNQSPWTIIPRLTLQEMFTDNAYEVTDPRRADAITIIAPGISIAGDTAHIKLNLDYQPNLLLHAINGPLNVVTQQLTAVGLVTVVPNFAYVDVRAFSGVQSALGALAGAGTLGAGNVGIATPGTAGTTTPGTNTAGTAGTPGTTGEGLNRNNEVQTSSFGISPYLLGQFGDYGSGKLGVSANAASYNTIHGFVASPLPSGGAGAQNILTTEQLAHFTSGQFLAKLQYAFDADIQQSRNVAQAGTVNIGTTTVTQPAGTTNSQRETFNNSLSYAVNHAFTLTGSIGYQNIEYSGLNPYNFTGVIWNAGFTYAPGPYTSLTMSYGRQAGTNAFQASGYAQVGKRTTVTVSYSNTVGSQLENLQNQLNASAIGAANALVNVQTGGPTLVANNELGVQSGVFRFNTFVAAFTTVWDRDTFQGQVSWTEQTSLTPGIGATTITPLPGGGVLITPTETSVLGPSTTVESASLAWTHLLSPATTLNSNVAYSYTIRNAGENDSSFSTSTALQYLLTPSTTLTARYSFFDRVSKIPGYSLYENILLLGITKQF